MERQSFFNWRKNNYLFKHTFFSDICDPLYSLCNLKTKSYHLKFWRMTTYQKKLKHVRPKIPIFKKFQQGIATREYNLKFSTRWISCWGYLHATSKIFTISYTNSSDIMEYLPLPIIYL